MAKLSGAEKRRHVRIGRKIGVNIINCNGKKTIPKLDEEVGLNVSIGGVLIECSKRLARGTKIKLILMLTFDAKYKIIEVPAKVSWNKQSYRKTYYLGCKFQRLKPKDRNALVRYVKQTLP